MTQATKAPHPYIGYSELELPVTKGCHHLATCIWMHGLGGSPDEYYSWFQEIRQQIPPKHRCVWKSKPQQEPPRDTASNENDEGEEPMSKKELLSTFHQVKFIFPGAPVMPSTKDGGVMLTAWYDIVGGGLSRLDEAAKGIETSCQFVHDIIARESKVFGGEKENTGGTKSIILAGFSQGGTMTIVAGHTCPVGPLGGMYALSGYVTAQKNYFFKNLCAIQKEQKFVMCHGDLDEVVLPQWAAESHQIMQEIRGEMKKKTTESEEEEVQHEERKNEGDKKAGEGQTPIIWMKGVGHTVTEQELVDLCKDFFLPVFALSPLASSSA